MLLQGQLELGKGNHTINWFAQEPSHNAVEKAWNGLGRSVVNLLAGLMLKLDVVRPGPLPKGAKIIAANHPTTTDPALIMTLTSEPTSILIHETLFRVPLLGRYLRRAGHVPVITGDGRAALDEARRLLEAGRTVVIFPEGALSPLEGGFCQPHTGVARLSLSTGAPVIPVGISLQRECIRLVETEVDGKVEVGRHYLHGPYAMTVGEPMYFEGDVEDRGYVRSASERIMQRIIHLSRESAFRMQESQAFETGAITRPIGVASVS